MIYSAMRLSLHSRFTYKLSPNVTPGLSSKDWTPDRDFSTQVKSDIQKT